MLYKIPRTEFIYTHSILSKRRFVDTITCLQHKICLCHMKNSLFENQKYVSEKLPRFLIVLELLSLRQMKTVSSHFVRARPSYTFG